MGVKISFGVKFLWNWELILRMEVNEPAATETGQNPNRGLSGGVGFREVSTV